MVEQVLVQAAGPLPVRELLVLGSAMDRDNGGDRCVRVRVWRSEEQRADGNAVGTGDADDLRFGAARDRVAAVGEPFGVGAAGASRSSTCSSVGRVARRCPM